MKCLIEKSTNFNDFTFYLSLFKMHKSYLLLISDQAEMGIGSVTLGSPPLIEGLKPPTFSYNLFGSFNKKLLSTIISEKASKILSAPVLLLLFLKIEKKEEDLAKPLVTFLTEVLTEITNKN